MKRFSEGPGAVGIALLALLLACALFSWISGVGAIPEAEARSMAVDDSLSVTVSLTLGDRPGMRSGRSQMPDDFSEIDGATGQSNGVEIAPAAPSESTEEDSSDLLPRLITLVVILSVVLVVLALLPKKNKTH